MRSIWWAIGFSSARASLGHRTRAAVVALPALRDLEQYPIFAGSPPDSSMGPRNEYVVAVTGSGGFHENKQNPSSTVRDELPERIERQGHLPIRVLKYHFDFRNVLKDMERFPSLWNGKLNVWDPSASDDETVHIDGMIHMGMKPEESRWVIEMQARRDGYDWVGDDDKPIPSDNGGEGGMFEGVPKVLRPMFDVEAIGKRLHEDNDGIPTGVSNDTGLKYCELQFFTSLAILWRRQEPARVMYYHVTGSTEDVDIKRGVKVGVSLIEAMVEELEEKALKHADMEL